MRFYQEPNVTLYCGHALDELRDMPGERADCVMTSPPYWGLRTYKTEPIVWGDNHCEHEWDFLDKKWHSGTNAGQKQITDKGAFHNDFSSQSGFCLKCGAWKGELGLEPTIELYIDHLIQIFDEVKRVLKKTGTCWVNIDDSYAGSPPGHKPSWNTSGLHGAKTSSQYQKTLNASIGQVADKENVGIPPKSLCLIPSRFALAMVNSGWILRNDIVWNKSNPMPESVKDRFTGSWEHLFFFVKSQRYFFEQQFEPILQESWDRLNAGFHGLPKAWNGVDCPISGGKKVNIQMNPLGRNKRDVWLINTEPYPEAHFATFPEKLCEIPILAGCPSHICKKCGKAREKIYEFETIWRERPHSHVSYQGETLYGQPDQRKAGAQPIDKGYTDCGCNAGFEPGIVLDPFCGSGKALAVAKKLGRKAIGIDLNPNYCKLTVKEIQRIPIPMDLV